MGLLAKPDITQPNGSTREPALRLPMNFVNVADTAWMRLSTSATAKPWRSGEQCRSPCSARRRGDDRVHRAAEVAVEVLGGGAGAEQGHADAHAAGPACRPP